MSPTWSLNFWTVVLVWPHCLCWDSEPWEAWDVFFCALWHFIAFELKVWSGWHGLWVVLHPLCDERPFPAVHAILHHSRISWWSGSSDSPPYPHPTLLARSLAGSSSLLWWHISVPRNCKLFAIMLGLWLWLWGCLKTTYWNFKLKLKKLSEKIESRENNCY